ncbi:GCN1 (YGL195W) [Zygosaccharomyces parabailii]|nr:GCN1 (YGL195W) [Zygosaccharomyces parabailii]
MSSVSLSDLSQEELSFALAKSVNESFLANRLDFLKELHQFVLEGNLETPQLSQISSTLLNSYSIFHEGKSKKLVTCILLEIVKVDSRFLTQYGQFILNQVTPHPGSKAVSDYLNLLEWIHAFYKVITLDKEGFPKHVSQLLEAHFYITFGIEDNLDNQEMKKKSREGHNHHRERIRRAMLQSSSKTFVSCLKDNHDALFYFDTIGEETLRLFKEKKAPAVGFIVVLGALCQASVQLLSSHPTLFHSLKENRASQFCELIGKDVILGKNPPSELCLKTNLSPFMKDFVTEEQFAAILVPNLEKACLRAPEKGFKIAMVLYSGVNSREVNLLHIFVSTKLISQSFSSFKSSKENVRLASIESVLTLLSCLCIENTSSDDANRLVDEIFKNIKANMNTEYKSLACKVLCQIPNISEEVSTKILSGLSTYVTKEVNEIALESMLDCFFTNYFALKEPNENFSQIIANGFVEKKPNLKKLWLSSFTLNSKFASDSVLQQFGESCIEFTNETLSHYQRHDHIAMFACFEFIDKVYGSQLSNIKLKLGTLIASFPSPCLGDSFLQISLSTSLSVKKRMRSVELLEKFFQRDPELIGCNIIEALEKRIQLPGFPESGEAISFKFIVPVFSAISKPVPDKAAIIKVLIKSFIISQCFEFNLKNGWAGLVLNAMLDPANIMQKHGEAIVDDALSVLNDPEMADTIYGSCAVQALSYAAFINQKAISPLLARILENDLEVKTITHFTQEDIAIWKEDENEMVFNVLEKDMDKKLTDKNNKDYETLKWEQSIRREQAKKSNKKLTKEEQELVKQELAREAEIRKKVTEVALKVNRGVRLVHQLAQDSIQVDTGIEIWLPIAVTKLLELTQSSNSAVFLGSAALDAFLSLSSDISNRLGSMSFYVGLATLRVKNAANIPANFLEEHLPELLSRVLFRVKIVSQQAALDSTTLIYMLPLLINVLQEGKRVALMNANKPISNSEFVEEAREEEHLLLAMDVISSHAEVFSDPSIPRDSIMQVLLSLLALPSKAKMAKACFNALCQSISLAPTTKDLQLLLSSTLSSNQFVRSSVLEVIDNEFELEPFMSFSAEIFICKQDTDETCRSTADFIWDFSKFKVSEELLATLLSFFHQSDNGLRLFTARAYAAGVECLQNLSPVDVIDAHLSILMDFYLEKAKPLEPIIDNFGLVVVPASERKDPWEERSAAALAMKQLVAGISNEGSSLVNFITFLIEKGAIGDRKALVRQEMKEAGIEAIEKHGSKKFEDLIPVFESALSSKCESAVKENTIILYGSVARHLDADDQRIHIVIGRLLATLETPSFEVQHAISECLSQLVFLFEQKVEDYVNQLMDKLLDTSAPKHVQKGAAWGIAGLVKGYGISSLSKFDIVRNLIEAAEDKKEFKKRESVAYAFQYLSISLGKFFEPYVIELLPNILKNLGDSVPDVRNATAEATKAIMAQTTSYGVTKLIPVAVSNMDDISWRTTRGSVELLGNMAYLNPTQLSSSLSTIVPEIVGVLNDSHKEVRKAADESLKRFGEVIRNPEIQKLVPVLIKAIGDPTKYTEEALDALIHTQFVHYIDSPSLALIIHVIHRGMHDRSANTKRKACKIVGNMAILVDTRDLVPYLQQLIDEVEVAMVDPVPGTRATAARALGALVERLGEDQFPDLIPRLMDTLSDDRKSGDRLGSAQALAEVISGLGLPKLEEMLPSIMSGVTSYRSSIREGFMPLLVFLPVCFGAQFAPYLNQIIQPILAGLADSEESIRDTALKAGRLVVKNYASKAIDLLLPELERGIFDENERIRLSSVQLTGELLFQVTGISSKNEFSEEDNEYSGQVTVKMVEVLGQERRDRVVSALFVCRNDTSGMVRASAVDIWKALVPNTPRTVKEVLPTLISMVVLHLASSSGILRHIAAQTLGDMVRRVGGNALSQLLPTLEESLKDTSDPDSRQGVCIALRELIESSSVESLSSYQATTVNIIRDTLVDSSESVRKAAASCFDAYQEISSKTAIEEVLPYLLNLLETSSASDCALLGLQEIMSTKSEVIFPILIPTLLEPPIDAFRSSALSSLSEVAGSALYKRLSTIINSLVDAVVSTTSDSATKQSIKAALSKIFLSVTDEEGLHPLLQQIMSLLKSDDFEKRLVVLEILPQFFSETVLDYDVYTSDLVSNSILSLDDKDSRFVQASHDLLLALISNEDKSKFDRLVKPAKQALQMTGKSGEDLPAFTLPKGPNCILPVFLHGLMYGSSDEREDSALAIADVVSKTPAANLRPFVSVITGPLIRVVGERFNSDIKAGILFALNILFAKIPQFLRPFIPQLQRTFVKSLSDPSNETLRLRAAKALGTLIEYQPRVDPLVIELVTGAKQATDEGVRTAMLKALLEVVTKSGLKMNENSKVSIVNLVEDGLMSSDDKQAAAYANLIGSISETLSAEQAQRILKEKVLEAGLVGDSGKFGILALNSFIKDVPAQVVNSQILDDIVRYLLEAIRSPSAYFSENALLAAGKLLLLQGEKKSPYSKIESEDPLELGEKNIELLIAEISAAMLAPVSTSTDARRLTLVIVRTLARFKFDECVKPFLNFLGVSVFSCLRDVIIPIKLAAEKAYLAIFRLVEEPEMNTFNTWFLELSSQNSTVNNAVGTVVQLRSIGDYTRRVGKRLANVERERIAEGGDAETMFSDRFEDEREIWAVGGLEVV